MRLELTSRFDSSNAVWAKIGGISLKELNMLEVEYLFRIRFDLFIGAAEYEGFTAQLVNSETRIRNVYFSAPLIPSSTSSSCPLFQHTRAGITQYYQTQEALAAAEAAYESDLSRVSTPTSSTEAAPPRFHRGDKQHHLHSECDTQETAGHGPPHHRRHSTCAWEAAAQPGPHGPAALLWQPCAGSQPMPRPPSARGPPPPPPLALAAFQREADRGARRYLV